MEKYFGGPVVPTILKLAVVSFLVGIVLVIFGIEPYGFWTSFLDTVVEVWNLGFEFVGSAWGYFVIGAIIVVPIWIVIRVWSVFFESNAKDASKSSKDSG